MTLTEKELRELDAWIAGHVMGWKLSTRGGSWRSTDEAWVDKSGELQRIQENWKPTTDPAAAMEVLKKCGEETKHEECIYFGIVHDQWIVGHAERKIESESETLELAICLFAKKLFSK